MKSFIERFTEKDLAGAGPGTWLQGRGEIQGRVSVRLQRRGMEAPALYGPWPYEEFFMAVFTAEKDALIENALLASPVHSAHIYAGLGWTGKGGKAGSAGRELDRGYPSLQAAWASLEEGESIITNYRATFAAGSLSAKGIDRAGLFNRENDRGLAFARIEPAIDLGPGDALQLFWEIAVQVKG